MSNDPQNPGSTPQSPAPAGRPAPVAPRLDLSHESPAIADAMRHPAFMDEHHPDHKDAVDRVFTMRQAQSAEPVAKADSVEGFGPGPDVLPDAPSSGDYSVVQWPTGLDTKAQAATATAARDFQIGASELSEVMKAAAPHMQDNRRYTYAEGEAALRKDLGEQTDATLQRAKQYVAQFPGLLQWLTQRNLANHPATIKIFAARMQGRATTQAEIDALTSDPEYLGGRDHAKHAQLVDRVFVLRQKMVG